MFLESVISFFISCNSLEKQKQKKETKQREKTKAKKKEKKREKTKAKKKKEKKKKEKYKEKRTMERMSTTSTSMAQQGLGPDGSFFRGST